MKREDRQQHRLFAAFAAFAVVMFALAMPLFLADDPADLILRSSTVSAADQSAFKLSQPVEIMAEPRIVVTRGTVSVAQPQGVAPLSSRAIAELLDNGNGVLILRDAEVVYGPSADRYAGASGRIDAPLAKALATGNYRALLIEGGHIEVATDKGNAAVFTNLQMRLRRVAGDRLVAKGSLQLLGRQLDFDTTIGVSAGDFTEKKLPIRGTVAAGDLLTASFSGQFALGDGGRLIADKSRLSVSDIPIFARWLGLSWPSEFGLATFIAEGRLEWVRQVVNFQNGRFQLDGNTAAGSLLVNGKGERPLIDGTLAFDKLDIGALLKAEPKHPSLLATTVRGTASWLPARVRDLLSEMSLPILRELDVDLRISAQQAAFTNFTMNKTAAALSLRDGRILLDLAEMALQGGGHGSMLLSVDPSSGVTKCGLRGKLKGVRIENVSDLVLPRAVITGPADVTIDLSGNWDSPETFFSSLDGRFGMRMENGATLEADLPALLTSMSVNESPVAGWGVAAKGRMEVETLSGEFAFKNGMARIERLVTERQGRRELALTGSVNIRGKSLDLNVFPRTAGSSESDEVPSVLNINGQWDKPQLVKRPFPNKNENPVYPESRKEGAATGVDQPAATRG